MIKKEEEERKEKKSLKVRKTKTPESDQNAVT